MKRLEFRSTFLSRYTKLDARQNVRIRYKPRHCLYTMLCVRALFMFLFYFFNKSN